MGCDTENINNVQVASLAVKLFGCWTRNPEVPGTLKLWALAGVVSWLPRVQLLRHACKRDSQLVCLLPVGI